MPNEYPTLTLAEAAERLLCANRILILIHRSPDGDAVGSGFALKRMLCEMGKQARVISSDPIPKRLAFLMWKQEDCLYHTGMEEEYDLLCAVDTASISQLGALGELAPRIHISLDHHGMNDPFCPNYTDPLASASGEILYRLYDRWVVSGHIRHNADAARALYAAIVSDTGSFKFSNTTRETLLTAANLLYIIHEAEDGGDDTAMLCHRLFECRTLSELYAQRAGIDALSLAHNGEIGIVLFTRQMMQDSHLSEDDIGNIVSLPRTVDGVKIALSVKQSDEDPTVWRVSSRASCDVDVSAVCAQFGGGGHRRAAGCTITAPDADHAYRLVCEAFGRALDEADEA